MVLSSCSLRGVALGAGTPKVIVPLTATTLPALLTQADSVIAAAPDVVEWRFDFLENALQADELVAAGKALRSRLAETPLLATFRTADEGGEQVVAPEAYAALYEALIAAGVPDAVDVEIFRDEAVVDRIIAAAHAADVAARAADNAGERDDGVFPEDRFHRADILSQHYINQREQSVEDKKKAAEKERARDKSEDGIEYVDLEDYKPGGKFSDQPAPPPELEDVKEPAPAVATFEAAPASGGVELESSLWTELL